MSKKIEISASLEDYLEAIYLFQKENRQARTSQIAEHLSVKKSSVSEALRNLNELNLINYKPYAPITLTSDGIKVAQNIVEKHNLLVKFFSKALMLEEEDAADFACQIEHIMSDDTTRRLKIFLAALDKEENNTQFLTKIKELF